MLATPQPEASTRTLLPPCPSAPPPPQSGGFTLIELLVVLTLLGILAGVSVAALPSLNARKAETVAARLAAARRTAIASGRDVFLKLPDPVSGEIRQWRLLPDGRAAGPGVDPRTGEVQDSTLALERAR